MLTSNTPPPASVAETPSPLKLIVSKAPTMGTLSLSKLRAT
jgi:hypothetical protein